MLDVTGGRPKAHQGGAALQAMDHLRRAPRTSHDGAVPRRPRERLWKGGHCAVEQGDFARSSGRTRSTGAPRPGVSSVAGGHGTGISDPPHEGTVVANELRVISELR